MERLVKLGLWTSRYWLLHEDGYAGEVLHNLHLNIAAGLEGSTEHRRGTDDNCTRAVFGGHVLDKVFERFEYARRLVCGYDEGVAFLLEHGSCSLDRGVDEGNDFKTQTEFTAVIQMENWVEKMGHLLFKSERVVPWSLVGSWCSGDQRVRNPRMTGYNVTRKLVRLVELTEHDIPGADEDDVKIISTTNVCDSIE